MIGAIGKASAWTGSAKPSANKFGPARKKAPNSRDPLTKGLFFSKFGAPRGCGGTGRHARFRF